MRNEPFKFTDCAICGKKFIKRPASIYHVTFASKLYQCCSYTCYEKAKQVKSENCQIEYIRYKKESERGG